MTAPRDMESICVTLESLLRLAKGEVDEARKTERERERMEEQRRLSDHNALAMRVRIIDSARAVLSLRKADDVAFRAAVTVLVTDILGAGCWDSSNNETETMP